MPKPQTSLFDHSRFGELMHSAESTHAAEQDVCESCNEHMLDCECEEESA